MSRQQDKLDYTKRLAWKLIMKHLPNSSWTFEWNNRIGALGQCYHGTQVIKLSKRWVLSLPQEEILDTILHEIAHSLAGHSHGHDNYWKSKCILVGANPNRLYDGDTSREDIAMPSHQMIDVDGSVIKNYYRKPNQVTYRKLARLYMPGRKEETLGKLKIIEVPLMELL